MTIKTFLVDDEPLARRRLRDLLAKHADVEIAGEFPSAIEAGAAIAARSPDLMFLDVQMPRMTGLKFVELLAEAPLPLVIFVTAYDSFAVEAFDTRAVDYLLKPVRPERLTRALIRARDQLGAIIKPDDPPPPGSTDAQGYSLSRLLAKSADGWVIVRVEDITRIESAGNYAIVHTAAERHIVRQTMTSLQRDLPSQFVRINRSLIVNVDIIIRLEPLGAGEYVALLKGNHRASITLGLRELEAKLRFQK